MNPCPDCGEQLVECEVEVVGGTVHFRPAAGDAPDGPPPCGQPTELDWSRRGILSDWSAGRVCPQCGLLLVRVRDPSRLRPG